jgi:glycogen synthase
VVVASVLKSISDIRSYGKIGKILLSQHPDATFWFIGQKGRFTQIANINSLTPFQFSRISFGRIFTEIIFFINLLKIKPNHLVISTYELLLASVLYKRLFKCYLVYDVQENYTLNITTGTFKILPVKKLFAKYVSLKEHLLAKHIDKFILAEKCFQNEIKYIGNEFIIIENKVDRNSIPQKKKKQNLQICITGTLGQNYGTIEAIETAKSLKISLPELTLCIIGFCADTDYFKKIQTVVKDLDYIEIIGGDKIVPYSSIMDKTAESHVSIMLYKLNQSFENKIPTKFYECIALDTKIITTEHASWHSFLSAANALTTQKDVLDYKSWTETYKSENIYFDFDIKIF